MAKNIRLSLSEPVIDMLAEKGYDSKMGARPLGRKIDELIRIPLSKRILFESLENCALHAIVKDDRIEFAVQDTTTHATVDQDGYIRIN
jgi:ATP-dependent Clp protease ATP-binding subunit ClpA